MSLLSDFAGPYGPFIWPAYGCAALIFAWMVVDTIRLARRADRAAQGRSEGEGS